VYIVAASRVRRVAFVVVAAAAVPGE
jgi:hypothetical protein